MRNATENLEESQSELQLKRGRKQFLFLTGNSPKPLQALGCYFIINTAVMPQTWQMLNCVPVT